MVKLFNYVNEVKLQWKESCEKDCSVLDFLINFFKHLVDVHSSSEQPPNLFFIGGSTELFILLLEWLVL